MNQTTALQVIYILILVATCIQIIMQSRQPARTYAFLLLILSFPVVGLLIYYVFGKDYRKNPMYSKKLLKSQEDQVELHKFLEENQQLSRQEFPKEYERFESVSDLVFADNQSLLTDDNKLELLINGEQKFPQLKKDLMAATDHIHMQYFIFENDKMGQEIGEILAEKAEQGVKVRVLYDYFGSISLKNKYIKMAEERGVEVAAFHKIGFKTSIDRLNYRNHRKIVVVDGKVGYTGGLNVSNDYINDPEYPSKYYWRDTHLRLEGKSVWSLQQLFLSDWNFAAEQDISPTKEYFPSFADHSPGNTWVQIVNSGPDSAYPSILNAYIEAVFQAEESIYLATPYYIPAIEFDRAIEMAALRGVDVHLLVPAHSDSWYANTAARSYYSDLLDAGVNIYFYKKGMFHAKTIVCDDMFSMVGTANLDYRSFDINFEVNAMIWDKNFAGRMIESFEIDLRDSEKITKEAWEARPKTTQFFEKVMSLFGPLL